jgi:hypothetical protein
MIYLIMLLVGVAIVVGAILLQNGALGKFFTMLANATTIDQEPKPVLEPSAKKEAAKKKRRIAGLVLLGVLLGVVLSVSVSIVTRPNTPPVAAAEVSTINPADEHKTLLIPASVLDYLTAQGFTGVQLHASDKSITFQGVKNGSWYSGEVRPTSNGWEALFFEIRAVPQK